jgi:hypothetical protein
LNRLYVENEATNVVPPAASTSIATPPLAPIAPKTVIARELQIQVKIGNAIREHRLRDHHELVIARQEKQEWVQRCTELLTRSFNGSGAAEQFNNWAGTILPEFAEFNLFVEFFDEEMKHRLNQLHAIAKALRTMPEPIVPQTPQQAPNTPPTKGADMPTVVDQTSSNVAKGPSAPRNPEVAAPATVQAMQAAQAQASLRTQAQRAGSPTMASSPTKSGLLIIRSAEDDAAIEPVRQFVEQLGLSLHVSKRAGDDSNAATPSTPLLDELSAMQSSASFALLFTNASDQSSSLNADALFDLGCCVGRLGASRVVVLHRDGQPHTDRFGLTHVVLDPHEGWRLQLARQLKRAGVDVDLNKLI